MAILEEIALFLVLPAETKTAIPITNRQHKNSLFSGQKTRVFGHSGGF
jgi:hypothetical protein